MEAIIICLVLVPTLFLVYYIRTKKLLYKLANMQKKEYYYLLDMVTKIERRCSVPVEDFRLTEQLEDWAVVISYNRPDLLRTTVTTIKKNEPNIKLLLIDNGSKSDTIQEIMKLKNEGLISKLILNRHEEVPQWQKSFAISQALKLLTLESVDTITFADDDIQVLNPWLQDSKELYQEYSDVKLICLMHDEMQNATHTTEEIRRYKTEDVLIKNSFNGAFFLLRRQEMQELGYPPINEGISDASVEDWYYTRQLQTRNWKVATINRCLHLGYNTSIRESL